MVTPDITSIRAGLEETYRENRALIAGLSDREMERPTPNPTWRVRQLAAHIAEDDGGTLSVAKLLAKGKNAKAPEIVINLFNWWSLRKHKRARAADLVALMERKHQQLVAWLETVTPEQLARGGEVSQVGRVTLAEFLTQNRAHSQQHGADIRSTLGRPPGSSPAG